MRYTFFAFLLLFFVLQSCDNSSANTDKKETTTTETAPTETTSAISTDTLPSIELTVLQKLWNECDYVDYVFYELPISLSLDNQASVRHSISHISETNAPKTSNCKAIGRIFYQIDGENELEGDIYFSQGCTYFAWLNKQGKVFAGNWMTEDGVAYMNKNMQAAAGAMQGGQ